MALIFTNTEYQLGTLIYWELCKPAGDMKSTLGIKLALNSTQIIADENETWLKDFPKEKVISREEAALALEEARGGEEWDTKTSLAKIAETYAARLDEIQQAILSADKLFSDALKQSLGHEPSESDRQKSMMLYEARKASLESRKSNFKKLNPQPELSWTTAVAVRNLTNPPPKSGPTKEEIEQAEIQEKRNRESWATILEVLKTIKRNNLSERDH